MTGLAGEGHKISMVTIPSMSHGLVRNTGLAIVMSFPSIPTSIAKWIQVLIL